MSVPHSLLHLEVGVLDRGLALRVSVPHSLLHPEVGVLGRGRGPAGLRVDAIGSSHLVQGLPGRLR